MIATSDKVTLVQRLKTARIRKHITPELDTDSVEILKLFGAMDEKTKQIMLEQMRAVARFQDFNLLKG